jgi:hypothetical protein
MIVGFISEEVAYIRSVRLTTLGMNVPSRSANGLWFFNKLAEVKGIHPGDLPSETFTDHLVSCVK